jgi:hypothetical protein
VQPKRRRNPNPELRKLVGRLGTLVRDGRHEEEIRVRDQLARAKRMAAIEAAVKGAPPLQPDELTAIAALLNAAAQTPTVNRGAA